MAYPPTGAFHEQLLPSPLLCTETFDGLWGKFSQPNVTGESHIRSADQLDGTLPPQYGYGTTSSTNTGYHERQSFASPLEAPTPRGYSPQQGAPYKYSPQPETRI